MDGLPTISAERTAELLDDAIDLHVHTAPDVIPRYATDLDTGREAIDAGMRGVVVKSHIVPTAGRVELTNLELDRPILYGGVTLNGGVGGINPAAVEIALDLGADVVWLPTAWSRNHAGIARQAGTTHFMGQRVPDADEDISLLEDGELPPALLEVVDLVAAEDAVLGTGHVSPEESIAVAEACADAGARCLVNHAFFRVVDASLEEQERLVDLGATVEYCAYSLQSTDGHTVDRIAEAVDRLGPEHCALATDFGQEGNAPAEGLARFAEAVVRAGVDEDDIRLMVTETPAHVLGL